MRRNTCRIGFAQGHTPQQPHGDSIHDLEPVLGFEGRLEACMLCVSSSKASDGFTCTSGEARMLAADEQPAEPAGAPVAPPRVPRTGALAGAQAPAPAAGAEQATITNVVEAATGTMDNATHFLLGGVSPCVLERSLLPGVRPKRGTQFVTAM